MPSPTTEAGRALYGLLVTEPTIIDHEGLAASLAAIEAEAVATERARIRDGVRGLATDWAHPDRGPNEDDWLEYLAVMAVIEEEVVG